MGQPQANQWARTAQKRSVLRSRRAVMLAIAALMAVAVAFGIHHTGLASAAASGCRMIATCDELIAWASARA